MGARCKCGSVAEAGGEPLDQLIATHERGHALEVMCKGIAKIVEDLHNERPIHGIISMGGSGGTAIGTADMRALPVNVPNLMVSTVYSGDTSPYVGSHNITMMPSIVDVSGLKQHQPSDICSCRWGNCGHGQS